MSKMFLPLVVALFLAPSQVSLAAEPELPRTYIDSTYTASSGASIYVPVGASLQAAINQAQPGDTILLEPGAEYRGAFTLPAKSGNDDWITIQTLAYSQLPPPGVRITSAHFPSLPKLITVDSSPAISIGAGARKYRLVGLELKSEAAMTWQIVSVMDGSNVVVDRCYIHGNPTQSVIRGVLADGPFIAVIDSHIDEIHWSGMDSQGIGAAKTNGPIKINNNFIAAAGENVMFGGSRSPIPGTVPSDIEIRGNHFFKPLSWVGSQWTVKNLLEFKNGQRAIIEGNVFENVWAHAQAGYAILFTVRTHDSGDWARVNDITFRNNTLKNVQSGFAMHGWDSLTKTAAFGETKRIRITNNSISLNSPANSVGVLWNYGTEDLQMDHNTFGQQCRFSIFFAGSRAIGRDNRIMNNVLCRQPIGDAMQWGYATLRKFVPEPAPLEDRFASNLIYVPSSDPMQPHPPTNRLVQQLMFENAELRLPGTSEYADVGANINQLRPLAEAAISGKPVGASVKNGVVIALDRSSLSASERTQLRVFFEGQPVSAKWSVHPAVGNLSADHGTYTAPEQIPTAQVIRLCARALLDVMAPETCTSLALKAAPAITLAAPTYNLASTQRVQFTAVVSNAPGGVSWRLEPAIGIITPAGLYKAPDQVTTLQRVTVIASSSAIAGLSKAAEITLQPPQLTLNVSAATLSARQQFGVKAALTGSLDRRLQWTLQPPVGTVDQNGLYTAPTVIAQQQVVQITAKLVVDPAISATAQLTLQPLTVTMTPATPSLIFGQSITFWPTVQGTTDKRVQWTLTPPIGLFDAAKQTYTYSAAPASGQARLVTITATSVADPSKFASVAINLVAPRIKIAVSDSLTLRSNARRFLAAAVYDVAEKRFGGITWEITPNIGTFDQATGLYTAPAVIAEDTEVQFTARSVVDPLQSATVVFRLLR